MNPGEQGRLAFSRVHVILGFPAPFHELRSGGWVLIPGLSEETVLYSVTCPPLPGPTLGTAADPA